MIEPFLLCSDLDRTLIPNGDRPESPTARALLRWLAARPEMVLAYVTGRHRELVEQAEASWELPAPDWVIGDVGTTISRVEGERWIVAEDWQRAIAPDWAGRSSRELGILLAGFDELERQEESKQNRFKLSYYCEAESATAVLARRMRERLAGEGIRANVVWSVDDAAHVGLIDVLPASASKLHAIRFLMERTGFTERRTVFSGDSGNDLEALSSGLQAVLVANARDEVRELAVKSLAENGQPTERLYVARGGLLGMNGNYAAGVLEGLVRFLPEIEALLIGALEDVGDGAGSTRPVSGGH